jgi:hypothetical protein
MHLLVADKAPHRPGTSHSTHMGLSKLRKAESSIVNINGINKQYGAGMGGGGYLVLLET